jgi:C1A family cysteine protease
MSAIAALVAVACAVFPVSAAAKTPVEYEQAFEQWLASQSLEIDDPLEYVKRLENFISNDEFIEQHNAEVAATGSNVVLGHNAFSHMSFEEFSMSMKGFRMPEGYLESRLAHSSNTSALEDVDLPAEIDWVKKGGVTPVKNQGQCGSCWAFSTTGAVEGAAFVAGGKLPNLSEQELVDCDDNGDKGCNGGLMDHAFDWIKEHDGICSESEYNYHAKVETCHQCSAVVKVTSYEDVDANNEHALKQAVAQQPVAVAIEADQRTFQFYKSGVFDLKCGKQLDHGVLVVGYGVDEENNQKFWKVKNSWGATWGEKGFIRLARELGPPEGQCGVAMAPSYPTASWVSLEEENMDEEAELPLPDEMEQMDGNFMVILVDDNQRAEVEEMAMELMIESMLEELEERAEEQAALRGAKPTDTEEGQRAKVYEFSG